MNTRETLFTRSIRSLICLSFAAVVGCAAGRPPVPIGTIPEPVPITPEEEQYGHAVLQELSQKWKLDYNHPRYQNVVEAVERLTTSIGADKDPWHVYVLKDDNFKNAAATRGNHVFIWTGMIDSTQNDAELATIIGHEIGHVLARHSDPDPNEKMREVLIQVAAMAAGVAVSSVTRNPMIGENAGKITAGLSEQVGKAIAVYPYSRDRELEADHIGLYLMAEAKYDPAAAVEFWQRAATDPSFSSSLAFFSTHPPAADRFEKLKQILPGAEQRYQDRLAGRKSAPPPQDPVGAVISQAGQNSSQSRTPAITVPPPTPTSIGGPNFQPPPTFGNRWRVRAETAYFYVKPNGKAKRIGEFGRGAVVLSVSEKSGWLHLLEPEDGYLRLRDVEAVR